MGLGWNWRVKRLWGMGRSNGEVGFLDIWRMCELNMLGCCLCIMVFPFFSSGLEYALEPSLRSYSDLLPSTCSFPPLALVGISSSITPSIDHPSYQTIIHAFHSRHSNYRLSEPYTQLPITPLRPAPLSIYPYTETLHPTCATNVTQIYIRRFVISMHIEGNQNVQHGVAR